MNTGAFHNSRDFNTISRLEELRKKVAEGTVSADDSMYKRLACFIRNEIDEREAAVAQLSDEIAQLTGKTELIFAVEAKLLQDNKELVNEIRTYFPYNPLAQGLMLELLQPCEETELHNRIGFALSGSSVVGVNLMRLRPHLMIELSYLEELGLVERQLNPEFWGLTLLGGALLVPYALHRFSYDSFYGTVVRLIAAKTTPRECFIYQTVNYKSEGISFSELDELYREKFRGSVDNIFRRMCGGVLEKRSVGAGEERIFLTLLGRDIFWASPTRH